MHCNPFYGEAREYSHNCKTALSVVTLRW